MGFFDSLFGEEPKEKKKRDWDYSVFDTDRYKNNGSGNWVDWEDVSTGRSKTDGFEHPGHDENGEW